MSKSLSWSLHQRIKHHLLLNALFLNDSGLLNGKMGIAITFYLLGRREENEVYADFAAEVLDGIFNELRKNTPVDFDSGLCGIGWGIEYLIQNQFVNGKSLEICEEIDKKITQIDPRRMDNLSLENGLCGLLHYVLIHIKGCSVKKTKIPFDNLYLNDLYTKVKELNVENSHISILKNMYIDYMENGIVPEYSYDVSFFSSKKLEINPDKITNYSPGICTGLAGVILGHF